MLRYGKRRTGLAAAGFTLVEMAIVLGVAGLLFTGLWRLLATGNAQMRDQATASQQAQLAASINTYLQSSEGQTFMAGIAANGTQNLTLPAAGFPAGNGSCSVQTVMSTFAAHGGLCSFLPPGTSSATTNPYGQAFSVNILKDNTAAGTAPQTFSFMINSSGGEAISDTSGGRISAMIGNDGGFVYSTDVCTTGNTFAATSCGSYGSWSSTLASYGMTGVVGHIATRTYYAPSQNLSDYWLARKYVPGDSTTTPVYNTMKTALLLGAQTFYLGSDTGALTGGGTIQAQGGIINLGATGTVTATTTAALATPFISLSGDMTQPSTSSLMNLSTACRKTTYSDATCQYVVQFAGDQLVGGLLVADGLYANRFIYQSSDMRLKTNIQKMPDPLGDMMKLNAVSFAYRADGKKSLGVIAQDVEKVYPELVTTGPSGMLAVSYEGLVGPLVGAVQELKKENDDLRQMLRDQSARQERLEQSISTLRRQ